MYSNKPDPHPTIQEPPPNQPTTLLSSRAPQCKCPVVGVPRRCLCSPGAVWLGNHGGVNQRQHLSDECHKLSLFTPLLQ
eukprot:m.75946 g.75946  ORF g.75946 m.75946 type:complete len:79 (+) comp13153_c0_seq4:68-304(+)